MRVSDAKHADHIYAVRNHKGVEPNLAGLSYLRSDISEEHDAMDSLIFASRLGVLRICTTNGDDV